MNRRAVKRHTALIAVSLLLTAYCLLAAPPAIAGAWDTEAALTAYLRNNYPWKEIEVDNVRVFGKLPAGAPEKIETRKGPLGKAVFAFIYRRNRTLIVKADVKALGNVVKSRRPFRKGHVITGEDIYIAKMDIRRMPNSSIRNAEAVVGKSLRRSIAANIPIVEDMIEKSRVVKRGKKVVLLIRHGGLNITAAGRTSEKGYVGMPVKAINLSSKKEVTGVLVDENTVRLEL
ncbi:MAG: flagellar basal body P-ring formation protein FlgA [Deferribacteres bacterium]|nr:flagellar basal body P-ring formation protein FlgA [Deferribacteres bacterium]